MNIETGKPDHIEDYLAQLHTGQWFGWSDSKNKIYANLIIHPKIWNKDYTGKIILDGMINNPHAKPTETAVNTKLTELQDVWDTANT